MYRLLIVDDEAIIADGLYEVFQNLGRLELDVYKAYSAQEALQLLNRMRIDIVLTDIRMPGMDGLQLLEEIHNRWPKCRVIFLTGYDEFKYVYTAIQYEGVNYLLKTEGYARIIEVVENAAAEIEASFKAQELVRQAREQLSEMTQLLQKDYYNGILKGEIPVKGINQQQYEELKIPLKPDFPVLMLLGSVDGGLSESHCYSENSRRLYSIRLIAEQYFSSHVTSVYIVNESTYLLWFIQPHENKIGVKGRDELWYEVLTFIKENLELVQAACKETLGISISFALDDSPAAWEEIPHRFSVLKMLLNYRIGQGYGIQLTSKSIVENKYHQSTDGGMEPQHVVRFKLESMGNYLEQGDKDAFNGIFGPLSGQLEQVNGIHHIPAQNLYYSLALVFFSYINQWNLVEKIAFKINLDKLMQINQFESFKEAAAYLRALRDSLFDIQDFEQEKRAQDIVSRLQKHIHDHIDAQDELSLSRLADLVYFNPSYLSRLFKQTTGMNLSDYICDARFQKVKELLQDPNMKICEVAQAMGYSSSANFVRFFRRIAHKTPQEYKDFLANRSIDESKVKE